MTGASELENFVRKFIFLWKSGCKAKLSVESKAGEAFVNLSVGLGQAGPAVPARRRGGAPARQRRTERRAAERRASAQAEEASDVNVSDENTDDQSTSAQNKFGQTDGTAEKAGVATFDVMVEAHDQCKNDDVIEALEENFFGDLKDKKIEKSDPMGYFSIREATKEVLDVQNVYRIKVKAKKVITDIIERWKKPYEFDDLAFTNAVYGEVAIKIKDVKRVS